MNAEDEVTNIEDVMNVLTNLLRRSISCAEEDYEHDAKVRDSIRLLDELTQKAKARDMFNET